jgi:murein endopeptidase
VGLPCDELEVANDGGAAQVEQVFADAAVAGAAALPVADVGQGVLDLDAFAQFGAPGGVAWRSRSSASSASSGWMATLRPLLLVVHRSRSGQAAQAALGMA